MDSSGIKKDMDSFQKTVMTLSGQVGKAGSLWTDPKYAELSAAIRVIAKMSVDVIAAGDKCCVSINKFQSISSEKI